MAHAQPSDVLHSAAHLAARDSIRKAKLINPKSIDKALKAAVDGVIQADRLAATKHHPALKTVADIAEFVLSDVEQVIRDDQYRREQAMGSALRQPAKKIKTLEKPKIAKKLASSGSLEELKKMIADFYASKPDRITFVDRNTHWQVQSGEKTVTPVVVQQGQRFIFGTTT